MPTSKSRFKAAEESPPPIHSRTEALDIVWRELAPMAEPLLLRLGGEVAAGGAVRAVKAMFTTWRTMSRARHDLRWTSTASPHWQPRWELFQAMQLQFGKQAGIAVAAVAKDVQAEHPEALPEQVLLLTRDRYRELLDKAFEEEAP